MEDRVWDGTGWYVGVPVPGAGEYRRQPLGGCDEAAVRAQFWKTLVKTEGHGKFLYEKSLEWQRKQRSKKSVNAAATTASGQARVTFEKGKDWELYWKFY